MISRISHSSNSVLLYDMLMASCDGAHMLLDRLSFSASQLLSSVEAGVAVMQAPISTVATTSFQTSAYVMQIVHNVTTVHTSSTMYCLSSYVNVNIEFELCVNLMSFGYNVVSC